MTALSLLALLALLLGPSALLAARQSISASKSLAPAICAQALFLYAVGLALPLSYGFYALAACSLACWAGAAFYALRDVRGALRAFLTPGLLFFLLLCPLLYYGAVNRMFISFDEFSHWGLAVKLMNATDGLFGNPAAAPYVLYDYPPALALVEWLVCRFLGAREGVALFGYQLLLVSFLLPFAEGARWRQPLRAAASLLLPLLLLNAVFPMWTLRLFSEPAIGLLTGLLFYELTCPGERPCAPRDCVLLAFLVLCKNTGLLFGAFYLLALLAARRERLLPCLLTLLLAFGSWALYCAVTGVGSAFSTGIAQNVSALLSGTLPAANASAPLRFLRALFTHSFTQAGIFGTYAMPVPPAPLLLASGGLCVLGVSALPAGDRPRARRAMGALWGLTAGYLAFIAFSYLLIFKSYEAEKLSEFERYVTLALLMTALPGGALCLRAAQAGRRAPRAVLACCLCLLAVFGNTRLLYETLVARTNVTPMHWQRYMPGELASLVRASAAPGDRVLCVGGGNAIALRYELAPDYDVRVVGEDWMAAWTRDAAVIREELAGFDFAVTFDLEGAQLCDLFEGEMRENSLYRVSSGAEGPTLSLIASAPEPPA